MQKGTFFQLNVLIFLIIISLLASLCSTWTLNLVLFKNALFYQGGMDSQLFTCCGSPAYAAPELVSGREYLGSEVRLIKNLKITIYFFFFSLSIWSWLYFVNKVHE